MLKKRSRGHPNLSDATTNGQLDTNKLKPCMVPMIEQAEDCSDDDLCIVIDPEYVETFKEKNYVIPIGSTVTCQAKDVSFMRGITPRAITVESLERTRSESSIYRMVFRGYEYKKVLVSLRYVDLIETNSDREVVLTVRIGNTTSERRLSVKSMQTVPELSPC